MSPPPSSWEPKFFPGFGSQTCLYTSAHLSLLGFFFHSAPSARTQAMVCSSEPQPGQQRAQAFIHLDSIRVLRGGKVSLNQRGRNNPRSSKQLCECLQSLAGDNPAPLQSGLGTVSLQLALGFHCKDQKKNVIWGGGGV